MVYPQHVVILLGFPDTLEPPLIAGAVHFLPVVQRISPQLSGGGEQVRRNSGDAPGIQPFVQFEQLRVRPHVGAVRGNVYRDIAYDLYPVLVAVAVESVPLPPEDVLHEFVELYLVLQFVRVLLDSFGLSQLDGFLPFSPGSVAESLLEGGKQRVVLQPVALVHHEGGVAHIVGESCESLLQQRHLHAPYLVVVNKGGVGAVIRLHNGTPGKVAVLRKFVKVDEQRVPGKGRKRLIGRIPIAGGSYREHLPVFLSGAPEPVGEALCFRAESSYAVGGRQAGDMHEYSAASHGDILL